MSNPSPNCPVGGRHEKDTRLLWRMKGRSRRLDGFVNFSKTRQALRVSQE